MPEIGLVSCTKTKRNRSAPPADLYTPSVLFSKARRYCERHHDEWYVLSAKHHLLEPNGEAIEPYDDTLTGARVERKRDWARTVFDELETRELLRAENVLVFHTGRDYYEALRSLLDATDVDVWIPVEGLQIGERLAWYNERT